MKLVALLLLLPVFALAACNSGLEGIGSYTVVEGEVIQIDEINRVSVESVPGKSPQYKVYRGEEVILTLTKDDTQNVFTLPDFPYTVYFANDEYSDANVRIYRNVRPASEFRLSPDEGFSCGETYIYYDYHPYNTNDCMFAIYKDRHELTQEVYPLGSTTELFDCGDFQAELTGCENRQMVIKKTG